MWIFRIIVFLLWVLSLVGISFYGGPVSYGFFAFMTLIPVLMLIYLVIVYLRFRVYQKMEGRYLVANHVQPFLFTLQNESPILFASVKVNLFSAYSVITGQMDGIEYELMPHSGVKNNTSIVCRYRGVYQAGIRSIEIRDFLHLFRFTYKNKEPLWVIVKPDLIEIDELTCLDESMLNTARAGSENSQPDILVRDYVPGDDIRFMHWKSTARTHSPMIRERTGEEQERISFILSSARTKDDPALSLPAENKMLETLLAVALYFVKKGIPISSWWIKETPILKTADHMEAFNQLYEELSLVVFSETRLDSVFFPQLKNSAAILDSRMVFLILQEWTKEALDLLDSINKNNIPAVVFLVSDDEEARHAVSLPLTQVIPISPEDDLKEVL